MSYTSQALQVLLKPASFLLIDWLYPQVLPSVISPDDRKRLVVANMLDMEPRMALYQEMIDRDSDSHPSLLVKLAVLFVLLNAGTLAIALYHKVRLLLSCILSSSSWWWVIGDQPLTQAHGILSTLGIVETGLDVLVEEYGLKIDEQVNTTLASARESNAPRFSLVYAALAESHRSPVSYYQTWKQTKVHAFPTSLPQLLPEAQEVKSRWQELAPKGSSFFDVYLIKLAIETNHIESTFLLAEEVRYLSVDHIHFVPSLPLFPVNSRLDPAWRFRGSSNLSFRKLTTRPYHN